MINDNSETKDVLKRMDHNPKAFFLYSPEGHYQNATTLYASLQRALLKKYYGSDDSFKGTIFNKCESPNEVFHLNRRTKLTIK
jgi:hypothetical protein